MTLICASHFSENLFFFFIFSSQDDHDELFLKAPVELPLLMLPHNNLCLCPANQLQSILYFAKTRQSENQPIVMSQFVPTPLPG